MSANINALQHLNTMHSSLNVDMERRLHLFGHTAKRHKYKNHYHALHVSIQIPTSSW